MMCTVITAAELSPSKLNKEHSTTLQMKYGLLLVDKTGAVSPEISETVFSSVNLLNAVKQIIFIASVILKNC